MAGEISTSTYVDIPSVVRSTIRRIGYTRAKYGFDADTCGISVAIDEQSPDIAQGVDKALEARGSAKDSDPYDLQGAGDQGLMFGYATDETPELMPLPIMLAHRLCERLAAMRARRRMTYLRPDGKSQVTVRYVDGGRRRSSRSSSPRSTRPRCPTTCCATRSSARSCRPVLERLRHAGATASPSTSTPPACSWSAARSATAASRGARSSWTPTAAWPATAAAPSAARTPRRLTARPPTRPAGWPRTWSRPASPSAARCRSPTPSASRTRCP